MCPFIQFFFFFFLLFFIKSPEILTKKFHCTTIYRTQLFNCRGCAIIIMKIIQMHLQYIFKKMTVCKVHSFCTYTGGYQIIKNVCSMQKNCTCETKSCSACMNNSCKMHACGINVGSIYLHSMHANISQLTHKCYLHVFCIVRNIQATSMLHSCIFVRVIRPSKEG